MYIILTGTSSRKKEGKTKKKDKSETEINGEVIYMVNLAQVTRQMYSRISLFSLFFL